MITSYSHFHVQILKMKKRTFFMIRNSYNKWLSGPCHTDWVNWGAGCCMPTRIFWWGEWMDGWMDVPLDSPPCQSWLKWQQSSRALGIFLIISILCSFWTEMDGCDVAVLMAHMVMVFIIATSIVVTGMRWFFQPIKRTDQIYFTVFCWN